MQRLKRGAATPEALLTRGGMANLKSALASPERQIILDALEKCAGNQTYAAELLGMPRRTLVAKLAAYNIPRPRKRG